MAEKVKRHVIAVAYLLLAALGLVTAVLACGRLDWSSPESQVITVGLLIAGGSVLAGAGLCLFVAVVEIAAAMSTRTRDARSHRP